MADYENNTSTGSIADFCKREGLKDHLVDTEPIAAHGRYNGVIDARTDCRHDYDRVAAGFDAVAHFREGVAERSSDGIPTRYYMTGIGITLK